MRRPEIFVLTTVLLTGCAVGPKYQKPVVQAPPAFKELAGSDQWKTAAPSDGMLKGKWWEVFGDPQLNQLEEQVELNNYSVKQFEAAFRQARAIVLLDQANYYPTISSNPSITQSDRGANAGGGKGPSSVFSLPITASWEPDLWGRIRLALENATDAAQISAANLENARLSIQATLAIDYFTLLSNDMGLDLLNDNIAAYERYLQLVQNRFAGGVAARTDVSLAESQLYTTQAAATDLGVQRANFEHAIAVLTGRSPAEFSLPHGKILNLPPEIPVAIPSELLERRPDIAAQERAMAAANANVGIAETAFYPRLTLSATAGFQATALQDVFKWASRVWSTGPSLTQTLFDFGRRNATVDQTVAAYDSTVAAYRQTVLTAFQAVEDNLSTLRVLAQEAEQQAQAVTASENSLNLETERYKAGTDSYLNVITTQTIALNNERTAVTLLARRMSAAVNLILALGGGWDNSTLPTRDQIRTKELGDPANTHMVAEPRPQTD
jgi:NodT family efflux transporter outer membrane factor (OMF) lipoprotein